MTELQLFALAASLLCATCVAVRLVATPFIRPRYRRSEWFEGVLWAERHGTRSWDPLFFHGPAEWQRGVANYLDYRDVVLRPIAQLKARRMMDLLEEAPTCAP